MSSALVPHQPASSEGDPDVQNQLTEDGRGYSEEQPPTALLFPDTPAVLLFSASWVEMSSGNRIDRIIRIVYHTENQNFILIAPEKDPVTLQLRKRDGQKYWPWDLYVGVTVPILGRPTTFSTAERPTREWLDSSALRLYQKANSLQGHLRRFTSSASQSLIPQRWLKLLQAATTTHKPLGGTVPLVPLADAAVALFIQLRKYREVDPSMLVDGM